MMRLLLLFVVALGLVGCGDNQTAGPELACAAHLYSPYDAKNIDQCVNVCIKCGKGTVTTCSTSCRLKGAR